MHLLYVTSALPFSVEETFLVPEVVELQRREHRITIVPVRPGRIIANGDARALEPCTVAEPLLSWSIMRGAIFEFLVSPKRCLRAAIWMASSRSPFVLLKNLSVFLKGLWLAGFAHRAGVEHIHAHFASTNATVALIASCVSGIPWSLTGHRWDIADNNLLAVKARSAKFLRAIDLRGGRHLATLSQGFQHKVRVIHMGVAVDSSPIPDSPRRSGPLRVVLGARIDEFKGHRDAAKAIAQLKEEGVEVLLHCVGDGAMRSVFQRYAESLGVGDRVVFPGWLDHELLLKRLRDQEWDVAILPSIETAESWEGIPVFLIEAMEAGVPVIATETGGIPELLDGGVGILVPQQDSRSIAEALRKLSLDPELRRHLGLAGRQRVHDAFRLECVVTSLLLEMSSTSVAAKPV